MKFKKNNVAHTNSIAHILSMRGIQSSVVRSLRKIWRSIRISKTLKGDSEQIRANKAIQK
jgi:hypothetical protein